jgi:hypothetical protein
VVRLASLVKQLGNSVDAIVHRSKSADLTGRLREARIVRKTFPSEMTGRPFAQPAAWRDPVSPSAIDK